MNTSQKLSASQKGFAPIFIVILIALAVGGYLFYQNQTRPTVAPQQIAQPSPSPDETANWKTYTNTYCYSFQYPSQYFLSNQVGDNEAQNNSPLVFIYPNKPSINNSYKVYFIVITKNLPSGYFDASNFDPFTYNIKKILSAQIGDKVVYANGETTRLSDEQINGIIFRTFDISGEKRYTFDSNKYIYIIGIHNNSLEERKILSTFKFTK